MNIEGGGLYKFLIYKKEAQIFIQAPFLYYVINNLAILSKYSLKY